MTRKAGPFDKTRVLWLEESEDADGPHIATVPGLLAPIYTVDLPEGLRHGSRERVARRQISERLGRSEEDLEVRPIGTDIEWTRVLVCDRLEAETWRMQTGPGCIAILPDYLTLPAAEGVWTVRNLDDRVAVRTGQLDGFSADPGLAVLQLRLVAAEERPGAVLLLDAPNPAIADLLQQLDLPVFRTVEDLAANGHPVPSVPRSLGPGVNLLDPPDVAVQNLRRLLKRWIAPVALTLLALAIWSAGTLIEIDRSRDRLAVVREATNDLLRNTFLPSGPILDARLQVARRLSEIARSGETPDGAQSPLEVFHQVAQVISGGNTTLQSMTFRPQGGLETLIISPDFATLEGLAEQLRSAGLTVDVLEANAEDGGRVRARLQLRKT